MDTNKTNARIAGVLFITAAVTGILSLPFSGLVNDPDYLIKVAANANQVITAALFELIMAFACAGIAIWLYPVLKKHNEALALGSVGFRIIEAIFLIVAAIGLPSLVTLSQEYAKAGTLDASHFQTLGALILAVRTWASQVVVVIAFSLGALMYYYVFFQSRHIPRWLSGWGLVAITVHLAAGLLVMFSLISPFSALRGVLALPILLQEMVLAVWLIVKGFNPSVITSESA